jgi:hypothetical protein
MNNWHRNNLFAIAVAIMVTPTSAVLAQEGTTRSLWSHNGSTVYLLATGAVREFNYEEPRPGMVQAGAHPGAPLFVGRAVRGQYVGTAYIYNARCGRIGYQVSGPILNNYERVVLKGRVPIVARDCRVQRYANDTLEFVLLGATSTRVAPTEREIPPPFWGVWIVGAANKNACQASDWYTRGEGNNDYEHYTSLMRITARLIEGWELECTIGDVRSIEQGSDEGAIELHQACSGAAMRWRSKELWQLQTIEHRKTLVAVTQQTFDWRDDSGKPIANLSPKPSVSTLLSCE